MVTATAAVSREPTLEEEARARQLRSIAYFEARERRRAEFAAYDFFNFVTRL